MLRYADTCILLSLIFRDSGTEAALEWLERTGAESVMISHWTLTEFVSAAGIMARRAALSPALHREGLGKLRRFTAARLTVVSPAAMDFERASVWLEDHRSGLRAGDALHLAICARQGFTLITADAALAQAAETHALAVERIGQQ